MGSLLIFPLTLREANSLVATFHRHHKPAVGHRFSIGVRDHDGVSHGAAIVGRPVARAVDWRTTAEVTRLVTDGTKNACSMLYGASARAAAAMGFDLIQTYVLASEPGVSLRAAGWEKDSRTVRGRTWSCPSRTRTDKHPIEDKVRYFKRLAKSVRKGADGDDS